ncbi:MAG: hypothetical protein PUB11_00725 [Oscillospiraceae bacterium]|nr:hypothetical protein [Oscillospiraceae bacterium]
MSSDSSRDNGSNSTVVYTTDGFFYYSVLFPSGVDKVTDFNNEVLGIDAFSADFVLPNRFEVMSSDIDNPLIFGGLFSVYNIADGDSAIVGTVGYNIIPADLTSEDFIPQAIYNQIALGNDYFFDVRESYTVVDSSDGCETAIVNIYYSNFIISGNGEKINKGVICYDSSLGVYVAFDLDSDVFTEEQVLEIAKSINLYR